MFGASSFVTTMAMKPNAIDHVSHFPQAAKVVIESFYVDDWLIGADSIKEVIELQEELQELFRKGGLSSGNGSLVILQFPGVSLLICLINSVSRK